MDRELAEREWASALKRFTNRNAGRRVTLEVTGAEIGAQEGERDFPLRGVAYDRRDGRIEIMLGEQADVEHRLTHTVAAPLRIDVLTTEDGRDRALRVVADDSQTVLRFL